MVTLTDRDYRKAIDDSSYRQHFLHQLWPELGVAGLRLIEHLQYVPEGIRVDEHDCLMGVYPPLVDQGKLVSKDRFTVLISPLAFDSRYNLQEFTSQIIDHEGYHIYDFVYFPERSVYGLEKTENETIINGKNVKEEILKAEREVRAYSNQLERGRRWGFSDFYMKSIENRLKHYSEKAAHFTALLSTFDIDFVYEELEVIDVLPGEIFFEN